MKRVRAVDRNRHDEGESRQSSWRSLAVRFVLLLVGVLVVLPSTGCYTKRMEMMQGSIDTLRLEVEGMQAAQEVALRQLQSNLDEQENLIHALRAGSNVASQDMVDRIEMLSAKLDDTAERIARLTRRYGMASLPAIAGDSLATLPEGEMQPGVDAQTMYEQAARDFTQGRFELALSEFRDLLMAYPNHELSGNALYGVGEAFYALAEYDSSEVAYKGVVERYPRSEKVPAALYKLGMSYQKMGRDSDAKETFERLRQEYPRSGEAILAEERLNELERL
jgi:tol-pal system protein YbgF